MSARRNYQRIWKQDRRYLGGGPAPNIQFVPKGQGYTTTGPDTAGNRVINVSPKARKNLKAAPGSDANWNARYALEHEFARVLGPDAPLASQNGDAGAGLANMVANRLLHRRNTGKGNPTRAFRKKLPYFGSNSQQIRWPLN